MVVDDWVEKIKILVVDELDLLVRHNDYRLFQMVKYHIELLLFFNFAL
jgi:hypothetical protein